MKSLSTREREINYAFINFREMDGEFADCSCEVSSETGLQKRTGDNGVCDSGRSPRCNCDSGDSSVQAEASRAVGRDNKWNAITLGKRVLFEFAKFEDKTCAVRAQSSVEFAIVALVVVLIVVGISALLGKLTDGTFLAHAIVAASHNVSSSVSGVIDAFAF